MNIFFLLLQTRILQHHGLILLQQRRMLQHPIYQLLLEGGYDPLFCQLQLTGCYDTLTSFYWKEATTPLQACSLPQHHPSTLIFFIRHPDLLIYSILSLVSHHFRGLCLLLLLHGYGLQRHLTSNSGVRFCIFYQQHHSSNLHVSSASNTSLYKMCLFILEHDFYLSHPFTN